MKYRIFKETTKGGEVKYFVQKKWLFFWYFAQTNHSYTQAMGYDNEQKARQYIADCYNIKKSKESDKTLKIEYIYIFLLLCFCSCKSINIAGNQHFPHKCKYGLCPYKGLYNEQWSDSVANYTHSKFGDIAHAIDMVHLKKPNWTYEQICKALLIE